MKSKLIKNGYKQKNGRTVLFSCPNPLSLLSLLKNTLRPGRSVKLDPARPVPNSPFLSSSPQIFSITSQITSENT